MITIRREHDELVEMEKNYVVCPGCGYEDYFFHHPPTECLECGNGLVPFEFLDLVEVRVDYHFDVGKEEHTVCSLCSKVITYTGQNKPKTCPECSLELIT